jgi:hypothetical protein
MEKKQTVGQKVKGHFKKHKTKYIVGASVVAIGGVSFYIGRKYQERITSISMDVINEVSPTNVAIGKDINIENKTDITNNVTNTINMGGYTTKFVKRLSDGVIYETVGDAAKAAGVHKTIMSKHINGHSNDVNGEIYEIVGLGTA